MISKHKMSLFKKIKTILVIIFMNALLGSDTQANIKFCNPTTDNKDEYFDIISRVKSASPKILLLNYENFEAQFRNGEIKLEGQYDKVIVQDSGLGKFEQYFKLAQNCKAKLKRIPNQMRVQIQIENKNCLKVESDANHNAFNQKPEVVLNYSSKALRSAEDYRATATQQMSNANVTSIEITPLGTKYTVDLNEELNEIENEQGLQNKNENSNLNGLGKSTSSSSNKVKLGDRPDIISVERGTIAVKLKKVKSSKKVAQSKEDSEEFEEKTFYIQSGGKAKLKKDKKNKNRVGDVEVVYPEY